MPSRNVNLTPELEREYEAKLESLRAAIKEGEESGYAEPGSFERVRAKFVYRPILTNLYAPPETLQKQR